MSEPWTLSAGEAAAAIATGLLTSEELVTACLKRIDAREGAVHAWAYIDREGALAAAKQCDADKTARPLHGIPVGIKDVIDVAGMPTTHGSLIYADNIVQSDAACVKKLREAGAIILGKTVTAEFATYSPGPTTNPRNTDHTPGGSSSGSAAAVADYHVPLAIGTQTAGSVIRPASFTGVFGYKPSFGRWDKTGCLKTAPSLDTLGVFARSSGDIVRADAIISGDNAEISTPRKSVIGICETSAWPLVEPEMRDALKAFSKRLSDDGIQVQTVTLPEEFTALFEAQKLIHRHEAYLALGHIRRDHPKQISPAFQQFIDSGEAESKSNYREALSILADCKDAAADIFAVTDIVLTAGALGAAPKGLSSTGDPAMQRIWTAIGAPSLGFPAGEDPHGLPLGLQLVGMPGTDRAFLARAATILSSITVGEPRP